MKTRIAGLLMVVILTITQAAGPGPMSTIPTNHFAQKKLSGVSLEQVPAGLAPVMAQAIQADLDPGYTAAGQVGSYRMDNAANHIAAEFSRQGVALSGAAAVTIRLAAWGVGGELQVVTPAAPQQVGEPEDDAEGEHHRLDGDEAVDRVR